MPPQPVVDTVGETNQYFDLATFECHNVSNAFSLEMGQWTDDCAMGLCVGDSLMLRREFDGSDMRLRFFSWWNFGLNNAFRKDLTRDRSVGLGGNISNSIFAIKPGTTYGRTCISVHVHGL